MRPDQPFRLQISATDWQEMIGHALAEQPLECCGLFAGTISDEIGRVIRRIPLQNALNSAIEFESDPRSLLQAYRLMRAEKLEILAVYHSHPTSEPIPSKKDRERSLSEQVMAIIVGLTHSPPLVQGWWLTATDFRPAAITLSS